MFGKIVSVFKHGATPSQLDSIRGNLLGDKRVLDAMVEMRLVKQTDLNRAVTDPELEEKFFSILFRQINAPKDSEEELDIRTEIANLPPVESAAWILFKRKIAEKKSNLKLISNEED